MEVNIRSAIFILFIMLVGCNPERVEGCMDMSACNYNQEVTIDDESCIYPEKHMIAMVCPQILGQSI